MAKYLFLDTDIIKLLAQEEKPSGGAAVQSLVWIRGLMALGNEVSVTVHASDNIALKKGSDNIQFVPLYHNNYGLRWIRWVYYRFPLIYKAIKKNNPDYLYESIPSWGSFFIGLICRRLKVKYVIRLSSDNILDNTLSKRSSYMEQIFMRTGLKLCHVILCQNDFQLNQVTKLFPKKPTLKIHNPIVLSGNKLEEKIGDRSYIAWLANFRFVKNLKLLYEIALLLENEQFKIAGVYSNKKDEETTTYLSKLDRLKNVSFVGYLSRNEVLGFLSKAKYLLNTSRHEGFSNTFLEALAVGTPVLTTVNANPDQIIDKNKIGIIYRDSHDLKSKLDSLTEISYQILSDHCFRYVKASHDHILLSHQLNSFLEEKTTDHLFRKTKEEVRKTSSLA